VPNGGEAEASRADSAAAAARQWESLLGEAWQELAREEEAALRAAGPEPEPGDEATNDEDADDVRRGVVMWQVISRKFIFMSAAVSDARCNYRPPRVQQDHRMFSLANHLAD
jgi:hypothetical protein